MSKQKQPQNALFHVKDIDKETDSVFYSTIVVAPAGSTRRQIIVRFMCRGRSKRRAIVELVTTDQKIVKTFQAIAHLAGIDVLFDDLIDVLVDQSLWKTVQ